MNVIYHIKERSNNPVFNQAVMQRKTQITYRLSHQLSVAMANDRNFPQNLSLTLLPTNEFI